MMFTSSILGRPLAKRQTWHAKPPESCLRRRRHPQKLNPSLPERGHAELRTALSRCLA
jgi:hypothetical protein